MASRSGAGALNHRVEFQQPVTGDDGHGGVVTSWETRFSVAARLVPKLGGEDVVAQRMQGKQPYIVTVRSSSETRMVTTAWRARNARTGAIYNIKSSANTDERGAYLDLLAVEGDDQ